jgi:tol-pal system protein YbgF
MALNDSMRSLVFGLSVSVGLTGCAHADSAAERHLTEMRRSLDTFQAERDRQLASLEEADGMASTAAPAPSSPQSVGPASAEGRVLRTVTIDGDSDADDDERNDSSERPTIRMVGRGGSGATSSQAKSNRSNSRIEIVDYANAEEPRASILDPEAKRNYDAALALAQSKQCPKAIEAFSSFMTKWPDHPYVENALYWSGECHANLGEPARAVEAFETMLTKFGSGNKSADALLKLGVCHDRLGAHDRARAAWDRLRRDHPRSEAAKKIPKSGEETRGRGAGPKEER